MVVNILVGDYGLCIDFFLSLLVKYATYERCQLLRYTAWMINE
jgi:hypothetical protein